LSSTTAFRQGIYQFEWVRRLALWLDALPIVPLVIEFAPDRVAAARWSRTGSLDAYAVESLPAGALVPSAVETNIVNGAAVKAAVASVCERLRSRDEDVAMILPDTVIRVFVQHFEEFPRSTEEAVPMLRWKLKKSVPFEADETLISFMRQAPREAGLDVVTALARLRIIRGVRIPRRGRRAVSRRSAERVARFHLAAGRWQAHSPCARFGFLLDHCHRARRRPMRLSLHRAPGAGREPHSADAS